MNLGQQSLRADWTLVGAACTHVGNEQCPMYNVMLLQQSIFALCMQTAFDDLESHKSKSAADRQAFWGKTRRLQHGTLALLWTETLSQDPARAFDVKITPCVISDRDEEHLAPRSRDRRPTIGLR